MPWRVSACCDDCTQVSDLKNKNRKVRNIVGQGTNQEKYMVSQFLFSSVIFVSLVTHFFTSELGNFIAHNSVRSPK
jgi:hypothetical protein